MVLKAGGLDAEQACRCDGGPSASLTKLQVIATTCLQLRIKCYMGNAAPCWAEWVQNLCHV